MGAGGIPLHRDSAAVLARPCPTLPCAAVSLSPTWISPSSRWQQDLDKAAGQRLAVLAVLLDTPWLFDHCSRAPCAAGAGLHPVPPAQGSPQHQHCGSQSHPQPGLGLLLRAEQPPVLPHGLPSFPAQLPYTAAFAPRGSLAPLPTKLSALQPTPWVL